MAGKATGAATDTDGTSAVVGAATRDAHSDARSDGRHSNGRQKRQAQKRVLRCTGHISYHTCAISATLGSLKFDSDGWRTGVGTATGAQWVQAR